MRIQPYFGHRSDNRLVLSARALRSAKPQFETSGRLRATHTMLAQFLSHEVRDLEVALEIARPDSAPERHSAVTGKEGFVHFDIPLSEGWQLPERTVWETVRLHWRNIHGEQEVTGHVLVPGSEAGIGVISDIDDTIIETGITGGVRSLMRNWRRVLQQMPEERIAVPGADMFYRAIGGGWDAPEDLAAPGDRLPASKRPFFYVSSSPWNLFSYLVAFKRTRGLPLGPIHLRDWGLNRTTFGSGGHGQHKLDAIRGILEHHPSLRFVLIGDDSQGDLVAFAEIAKEFGNRIAAIFIRRVGADFTAEEISAKALIRDRGVTLWLGDSFAIEEAFLESAGLGHDSDAASVVEATQAATDDD
ncbi:MAG: DUF2183 domain-containing protein [Sphingomonadaceae bacterium]|nr:MAG: DUF2183 domain-containing protein [Sphingomonadaceae bacterium]